MPFPGRGSPYYSLGRGDVAHPTRVWRVGSRSGGSFRRRVPGSSLGVVSACTPSHRPGILEPCARLRGTQRAATRVRRVVFPLPSAACVAGCGVVGMVLGCDRNHQRHRSSIVVVARRRLHARSSLGSGPASPGHLSRASAASRVTWAVHCSLTASMLIKVRLAGATGWAGYELARSIPKAAADLGLVAAVSRRRAGSSLGDVSREPRLTCPTYRSATDALVGPCDVFVEYVRNPTAPRRTSSLRLSIGLMSSSALGASPCPGLRFTPFVYRAT